MKKAYAILIALLLAEIALAFICAPHSCDWGNELYFYAGIFALLISFFSAALQKNRSITKRISFGFLFMVIAAAVWIACFMLFNFSIMCRLF